MKKLDDLRKQINEIDFNMQSLFMERFSIVRDIAVIKKENNLTIFNKKREEELRDSLLKNIDDLYLRSLYEEYLDKLLCLSKKYQHMLTDEFIININGEYDCIILKDSLDKINNFFDLNRKVLLVTDDGIPSTYINKITSQLSNYFIVTIPQGECNKNSQSLDLILNTLFNNKFSRFDCIVALGGGVICDLAGFAASIYERGIDCYLVPTTLLSMVDASIGGKTAINYNGVKNVIGSFSNPKGVLIDVATLSTLSNRLKCEGIAECIKMGLTLDKSLFDLINDSTIDTIDFELLIKKCILNKKLIVELDFREENLRRVLNFGHTIGHAIEILSNDSLLHGESVAQGMKYFCSKQVKKKLIEVLDKYNLNNKIDFPICKMLEIISHDKKSKGESVEIVYVNEIGSFEFHTLNYQELEEVIKGEKE